MDVTSVVDPNGGERVDAITGELFFASTNELVRASDYADPTPKVVIDLTDAHVWDGSAVATLDTIVAKYEAGGIVAEVVGVNVHREALHIRLTGVSSGAHQPRPGQGRR